jgi:hypothetical protein
LFFFVWPIFFKIGLNFMSHIAYKYIYKLIRKIFQIQNLFNTAARLIKNQISGR